MQLDLSYPDANDAHCELKQHITSVLVTRNWFSHGRSLSVSQAVRAMMSLHGTIKMLGCDPASEQSVSGFIAACISDVLALHVPGSPTILTVDSIACLFFTRALQRLCKAIKVHDISKENLSAMWPNRSQEMQIVLDCVWNGRCYLYHGKCNRKSMALLVCICAVSHLLRDLGDENVDDANACDADIMHLLARMQLCDGSKLLRAVCDSHSTM